MLMRRIGRPGLLGTIARTAIITGTATATHHAVARRQDRAAQREAEAYEEGAPTAEAGIGDQLARLASLRDSGALTDAEFAAAKQRLLA